MDSILNAGDATHPVLRIAAEPESDAPRRLAVGQ
jgi:hypothetical protein